MEGPDGPLYADFHALRHSYVALLDQGGVSLKQAMQLARHSDPKLTMARYGRAQLHGLGEAVRRLPALLTDPPPESQALRAAGTDPACTILALPTDAGCDSLIVDERTDRRERESASRPELLGLVMLESAREGMRENEMTTPGRIRTCDHRFRKPMLYPLSYGGEVVTTRIISRNCSNNGEGLIPILFAPAGAVSAAAVSQANSCPKATAETTASEIGKRSSSISSVGGR